MREGRRWVTERRREEKKVEAEGKMINQEAWSRQDWKPNCPSPNHCLLLFTPGSHPLHFPHVLESVSSERRVGEVAMVRTLSVAGRGYFLSCWSHLCSVRGSSCPRLLECTQGVEKPRHGTRTDGPSCRAPYSHLSGGGGRLGTLEILSSRTMRLSSTEKESPGHLASDSRA